MLYFFHCTPQFNHHQHHLQNQFLWTVAWKKNQARDTPEEGIFSHRPPSVLQLEAAQQEQPHHTLQIGLGQTKTTLVTSQAGDPGGDTTTVMRDKKLQLCTTTQSAGVAKNIFNISLNAAQRV